MSTMPIPAKPLKPLISLLLPDLRGGGAERVAVNLANAFVQNGHSVDMVLLSAIGEFLSDLDPKVNVVNLKVGRVRSAMGPLVRYMRDARPDACLACMWPLTVLAVLAHRLSGVRMRLLVAEHNTWSVSQHEHRRWIRPFIPWSMRLCFPNTDGVVAVSDGAATDLVRFADLDANLVKTIYNPVVEPHRKVDSVLDPTEANALWAGAKFRIINVGSLKRQKNQALLLRAMALLVQRLDAHLVILGEGQLRTSLEQQTRALKLTDRVTFTGFKPQPAPYFECANLFVLSSDYEGLPTVLIEALAAGTPVVSTDCPSGPREILMAGRIGRLVPMGDAYALADAMEKTLLEEHDKAELMARAQDFSIDKAADRYLELLLPDARARFAL